MKEAYVYKDNKIIAADLVENAGTEVQYDYQDNIEEIMKTENILEYLETEKVELTKKINNLNKRIKKNNKSLSHYLAIWVYYSFMSIGLGTFIGIISNIWIVTWILPLLITIIYSIFIIFTVINTNISIRHQKCHQLELEKIEEKIKENETLLETLRIDKRVSETKINEIKNKFNYVKYKEKLNKLKKYLETYRLIGKNIELYNKYYKKGILEEKLNNSLAEEQIKLIKKYIECNK